MNRIPRIVIADDDEDLLDALARRCELLGLAVTRAQDGLGTLRAVDGFEPDLVILDVNMPGGDGLGVREMLARDEHLRRIPVIVLTGRTDAQTVMRCHELMAYYVPKGPGMWSRVAPLLRELLRFDHGDARGADPAEDADDPAATREMPAVLCIDDDADFAESLRLRLAGKGLRLIRASTGAEGLRLAFTESLEAVMLDFEMPDGRGDYVLRRLKDNPVTQDLPVLVVTGHRDTPLVRRLHGMGAADVLHKPIAWEEIWAKLEPQLASRCGVSVG